MYKKSIAYTDYDGKEITEDFYFNLNEVEVAEMQTSVEGGYAEMIKKMINTKDAAKLIEMLKDLILRSYGVKSDDGKRFIKNPKIIEEFTQTAAYPALYMSLVTDEKQAADFVNKIFPAKLMSEAKKINSENSTVSTLPSGT